MTTLLTRFTFIVALLSTMGTMSHALGHDGHGPDFYRVHDVENWDVLNVRAGPGIAYHVVDVLDHNARGVQIVNCVQIATTRGPANWCLVNWQGFQRGWVNARFLREDY